MPGWGPKCPSQKSQEQFGLSGMGWDLAELLPLFLRELCRLRCHLLSAEEEGKSVVCWGGMLGLCLCWAQESHQ